MTVFNSNPTKQPDDQSDLLLEEAEVHVKPPPLYKVIMLNDDFTPMDFVVMVLVNYFSMNQEQATATMLEVHHKGRAVCGIYSREVAETKVMLVNELAKQHQHPLLCLMEQA